jgi:hypothetical protein
MSTFLPNIEIEKLGFRSWTEGQKSEDKTKKTQNSVLLYTCMTHTHTHTHTTPFPIFVLYVVGIQKLDRGTEI